MLATTSVKTQRLVLEAKTAADLMTVNPFSIRESASVRDAARFLTARGVTAAPVINEAGAPVGVLSQTDLVIHAREQHGFCLAAYDCDFFDGVEPAKMERDRVVESVDDPMHVRDLMTPTVFSVHRDDPATKVVEEFAALKVHRLFVTDDIGVLVGVISALDVVRRLRPNG